MANENKNQDELNANDVRDGEENGNFRGKVAGIESSGKKTKINCAIFPNQSSFLFCCE